jgi:hypothetical protein
MAIRVKKFRFTNSLNESSCSGRAGLPTQMPQTAEKYFSLLHDVQTGSGAYPASYSLGTGAGL